MDKKTGRSFAERYLAALHTHLGQDSAASLARAGRLGRQAKLHGMGILELAELHEQTLVALSAMEASIGDGDGPIARAGPFF